MRGSLGRGPDRGWRLLFPIASKLSWLLCGAELEGAPAARPVDDVARNLERGEDRAEPCHGAAGLFGKQVRLRPGLGQDLSYGEVPVRMTEQEFEELKLPDSELGLRAPEADHPGFWIEHRAIQVRQTPVPELEPSLVPMHLAFDDQNVSFRRRPGDRRELGHVAPDPIEDS